MLTHLFCVLIQFATSQISRTPTATRYISATDDKCVGLPRKWRRGDAVARKNSHPSFALTKRHLWEARMKSFSLLPGWLLAIFFMLCDRVRRRFRTLSESPRTWLFYYSTTIIPFPPVFFPFHAISSVSLPCVAIIAYGVRGWIIWIFQGISTARISLCIAFSGSFSLLNNALELLSRYFLFFYCLLLDVLYGNILHIFSGYSDVSTIMFFSLIN